MSIVQIIVATFLLMGFSVIGIAFWATCYPKMLCQKVRDTSEEEHTVCILNKGHDGPHMDVNGKKFSEKKNG